MDTVRFTVLTLSLLLLIQQCRGHCPCPRVLEKNSAPTHTADFEIDGDQIPELKIRGLVRKLNDIQLHVLEYGEVRSGDESARFDIYRNPNYDINCGNMWWRHISKTSDPDTLSKFSAMVQCQTDNNFCATDAVVINWENMKINCNNMHEEGAKFQAILAYNVDQTYLFRIIESIGNTEDGEISETKIGVGSIRKDFHRYNENGPGLMNTVNCCPGSIVTDISSEEIDNGDEGVTTYPGDDGCWCINYGCYECKKQNNEECEENPDIEIVHSDNDNEGNSRRKRWGNNARKEKKQMCMVKYEEKKDSIRVEKSVSTQKKCWQYKAKAYGECDPEGCDGDKKCVECHEPICVDEYVIRAHCPGYYYPYKYYEQ